MNPGGLGHVAVHIRKGKVENMGIKIPFTFCPIRSHIRDNRRKILNIGEFCLQKNLHF